MKKLRKKKRKVVSSEVSSLKREIERLVYVVQTLSNEVYATQRTISDIPFQRPSAENIRVVTQKPPEEPKTDFEKVLNWTTNQTNQHLNSLDEPALQEIINSALTGRPIPEKRTMKVAGSPMNMYLNDNYGTVVNQKDVWDTIADAKQDAKQRIADRQKQPTHDLVHIAQNLKLLKEMGKIQ